MCSTSLPTASPGASVGATKAVLVIVSPNASRSLAGPFGREARFQVGDAFAEVPDLFFVDGQPLFQRPHRPARLTQGVYHAEVVFALPRRQEAQQGYDHTAES